VFSFANFLDPGVGWIGSYTELVQRMPNMRRSLMLVPDRLAELWQNVETGQMSREDYVREQE
jgi:hypothetical protein